MQEEDQMFDCFKQRRCDAFKVEMHKRRLNLRERMKVWSANAGRGVMPQLRQTFTKLELGPILAASVKVKLRKVMIIVFFRRFLIFSHLESHRRLATL